MKQNKQPANAPKVGKNVKISENVYLGTENHRIQVASVEVFCPDCVTDQDLFKVRCNVRMILADLSDTISAKLFPKEGSE